MAFAYVMLSAKIEVRQGYPQSQGLYGLNCDAFLKDMRKAVREEEENPFRRMVVEGDLLECFEEFFDIIEEKVCRAVGGPAEMTKLDGIFIDVDERGRFKTFRSSPEERLQRKFDY